MARETRLLDIIETVYAAGVDGELWPDALTGVADLLGGVETTLEIHGEVGAIPAFFAAGRRLPDWGIDSYLNYYAPICPRIPYLSNLAGGSVGYDYDFMSESEIARDEFYSDLLAPSDLRYFAAGVLSNRPGRLAGVYIHRSTGQGHVGEADLAMLKQLLPHLSRSLDLHLRLRDFGGQETRFQTVLDRLPQGVITLDRGGRALFVNDPARDILEAGDGLKLGTRYLSFDDGTAGRKFGKILTRLLGDGLESPRATGDQVVVHRPSGRPPYILAVHRLPQTAEIYRDALPPAAVVFIHDPAMSVRPTAEMLAEAFSLTPRETDLANALVRGKTLSEHAAARGVKVSTERSHLKSLMQKTGTHRQADLIRLLSGGFTAIA